MKRLAICLLAISAISCNGHHRSVNESKLEQYALVSIGGKEDAQLMKEISDNGKEVLNLYRFAAMEADKIYWMQTFADQSAILALEDENTKAFAMLNYGPWDKIDGSAITEGFGNKPLGAEFYPHDMTEEEFNAWGSDHSPYTVVKRSENEKLVAVPYHEAYKEQIDRICNCLRAAADITIVPSVKDYLLAKISDLQTDNYSASNAAWMKMDSKMDLVLGPNEVKDDKLMGLKKSYGAYVLLKNPKRSAETAKFASMMPKFQKMLPVEEKYKSFVPGNSYQINVTDALYLAGYANAGTKETAISLPFDADFEAGTGTKTLVMENVVNAKFNETVHPISSVILENGQAAKVTSEAFFWINVFKEAGHGLGVKKRLTGEELETVLGRYTPDLEDTKADILGMYLGAKMAETHQLGGIVTAEDVITTGIVSMIRGCRFGTYESMGRAYVIAYNYFKAHGAFTRSSDGKYSLDYSAAMSATERLIGEILTLQAEGSFDEVRSFIEKYNSIGQELKEDFRNIRLEGIPLDIRFSFDW